jgi:peptidoglycan/LPS O-acetylase OafA/YrhL
VDSPEQLFSHLAYATEVLGYQWLNPVYWTLAIEFQFYLLIGLIFPFVMHSSRLVRYGTLLLFLLCAQLPISHPGLILRFLPWFSLGILACYYRLGMSSVHELWVGAAAIAALFWRQWIPQETFVLLATCLALAFWRAPCGRPLAWLGSISYSLYLTHIVFGAGFLVLGQALHLPAWFSYPLVIAATAFSIVTAAGFHRVVEAPALRLASRITLRPGSAPQLHPPTPVAAQFAPTSESSFFSRSVITRLRSTTRPSASSRNIVGSVSTPSSSASRPSRPPDSCSCGQGIGLPARYFAS